MTKSIFMDLENGNLCKIANLRRLPKETFEGTFKEVSLEGASASQQTIISMYFRDQTTSIVSLSVTEPKKVH